MNKIMMLRSTKWLDRHDISADFYCMLIKYFVDSGYFQEGEVWIQDKTQDGKVLFNSAGFKIECFKDLTDVKVESPPDVLYVRGGSGGGDYLQTISQCKEAIKIYWSGNRLNIPVQDIYDIVYVTDESNKDKLKNSIVKRLIKGVVEDVFKPLDVVKVYDICYVANVNRIVKNHMLLINALKIVNHPLNIIFVGDIVGGNSIERFYVEKIINAAKQLSHNITFTGIKDKKSVNIIMNQSNFGVICSEDEDSPRVLSEYMAAGIPVLCNKNLIDNTFYINKDTGITVSPDEFGDGIITMLGTYKSYKPFDFFYDNLRISVIAEDLYKTIREVCRNKNE